MEKVIDISKYGNLDATVGSKIANSIADAISVSLAVVRDEWVKEVQNTLHSTRPLYLEGLDFNSIVYPLGQDLFSGAVVLKGRLPNLLENGFPSFDEKIGFSKSSRRKASKSGGWYLTIPLRHSTPGSYLYGKGMPSYIYAKARKLSSGSSLSVGGPVQTSWTGYVHRSNINEGLTRIIKSYSNPKTGSTTNQSQYLTFRRVSDRSDPLSWIHPGYSGVNISSKLQAFALKTLEDQLKKRLDNL